MARWYVSNSLEALLAQQLDRDEGYSPSAYRDSLGYLTIGRGHLVDKRKNAGLSPEVIELQFQIDVQATIDGVLNHLPWTYQLNEARLGALLNMAFQLGMHGLLSFRKMLAHMKAERWQAAHDEALRRYTALEGDEWPEQTPARAKRVAKQILTGMWQ